MGSGGACLPARRNLPGEGERVTALPPGSDKAHDILDGSRITASRRVDLIAEIVSLRHGRDQGDCSPTNIGIGMLQGGGKDSLAAGR